MSAAGTAKVPETLLESSQDLYAAVQNFFQAVLGPSSGQRRQLLVGGESYAGKFVPGLGKACALLLCGLALWGLASRGVHVLLSFWPWQGFK